MQMVVEETWQSYLVKMSSEWRVFRCVLFFGYPLAFDAFNVTYNSSYNRAACSYT